MTSRSKLPAHPRLKSERIDSEHRTLERFKPSDDGRSLALEVQFRERATAMAFVGLVAKLAEIGGTCPKIEHVLGRVRVWLTTYEEGGVTGKDRDVAELLEMALTLFEATERAA